MGLWWTQDGKTLKVVVLSQKEKEASGVVGAEGPFASKAEALLDARSEYIETALLYRSALADIEVRLKAAR